MESEIEILKLLGCILNITGAGGRGLKWVMGSDFFWVCVHADAWIGQLRCFVKGKRKEKMTKT